MNRTSTLNFLANISPALSDVDATNFLHSGLAHLNSTPSSTNSLLLQSGHFNASCGIVYLHD